MNIAFLFNSDAPIYGGYYGPPIRDQILKTGVLQDTDRNMRASVGDVLSFMAVSRSQTRTYAALQELCEEVYLPIEFDRLDKEKLSATFTTATVYCWVFQNMTVETADMLHERLCESDSYLGAMDVEFSNPLHLSLFRNSLIEAYRFRGLSCSVFYMMEENEDPDISVKEAFERNGFSVHYENIGARRTIFDNFDSLEHFKRVASFKGFCSQLPELDSNHASDLAHSLEELHPKLFDAFAAAARTLERAETEEDFAQAALSGRRLLEKTANYLFPPQSEKWNNYEVGKPQYKNRLWAYIDRTLQKSPSQNPNTLDDLGKEMERLDKLFNSGLHAEPTKEKVELAFRDLVIWMSDLIDLDPTEANNPYLAYEDELDTFIRSALKLPNE